MDIQNKVALITGGTSGLVEKVVQALGESVEFPKRLGRPVEFASLVVQRVQNNYFNGETVRLDGAIRMQAR